MVERKPASPLEPDPLLTLFFEPHDLNQGEQPAAVEKLRSCSQERLADNVTLRAKTRLLPLPFGSSPSNQNQYRGSQFTFPNAGQFRIEGKSETGAAPHFPLSIVYVHLCGVLC